MPVLAAKASFLDNEVNAECLARLAEVNPTAAVGSSALLRAIFPKHSN
jgi:hypothetical protein